MAGLEGHPIAAGLRGTLPGRLIHLGLWGRYYEIHFTQHEDFWEQVVYRRGDPRLFSYALQTARRF